MIDGMMGRLGETAGLLAGDQTRGMVIRSGPKGVNSRTPLAAAVRSPEADRGVDNEFRPLTIIGVSG